jgi:hypothetical protein
MWKLSKRREKINKKIKEYSVSKLLTSCIFVEYKECW